MLGSFVRLCVPETDLMAEIDPDDDTRRRFIVWHYAFDPARHERRNQVVIAFDNASEFEAYVEEAAEHLRRRQAEEGVDPRERFSGIVKEPGDDARKAAKRELGWKLRNGTATDNDIAEARSLGFFIARSVDQER